MINVCKRWVGIFISVMYKVAHSSIHLSHDFHIQFPSQLLCLGCRSRRGQGGCPFPYQILSDQLILSQPGGERLCPTHYYILAPRIFRPSYGPVFSSFSLFHSSLGHYLGMMIIYVTMFDLSQNDTETWKKVREIF